MTDHSFYIIIFENRSQIERFNDMQYNTLQKTAVLDLFKHNPNKQFSADDVYEKVCSDGCGKSTVYRLLTNMCSDGLLKKYNNEGSKKSVYQLAGTHCSHHIHLRCVQCGTVIHLDDIFSSDIQRKIFENKNFMIDESIAVLPGKCMSCSSFK